MYTANPRIQHTQIQHPAFQSPQTPSPGTQAQQTPPSQPEDPSQVAHPGLQTQANPQIGELAAHIADLEARQASLEAQQGQQPQQPQQLQPPMGGQPSQGTQPPSPQGPIQSPQPALQQRSDTEQQPFFRRMGSQLRAQLTPPMQRSPPSSPLEGNQQPGQMQQGQPQGRIMRQPPVDILDEGDNLVLEIELPGARKEDIQLTGQRDAIQVSAPTREREGEDNLLQSERGNILYQRSIPLGLEIDSEQVDAEFEDGILRVVAPKRDPTSGPRRIEVE